VFQIQMDPRQVLGNIAEIDQRHLPFVVALTLSRTASLGRKRTQEAMPQVFDRPTPATIKGVLFRMARPKDPQISSEVYIQDEFGKKALSPNKWLRAEIAGGFRKDKRMEVALKRMGMMPKGAQIAPSRFAPLDQYGNLKGAFVTKILSQLRALDEVGYKANETDATKAKRIRKGKRPREFFVGRPESMRGRSGVWERIGTSWGQAIHPIVYFVRPHQYRVKLPMLSLVQEVHDRETVPFMRKAMEDAIRTGNSKGSWSPR
jgi:hypothetical protein